MHHHFPAITPGLPSRLCSGQCSGRSSTRAQRVCAIGERPRGHAPSTLTPLPLESELGVGHDGAAEGACVPEL